jgi:3-deoxy-manno-octulosonate cytidylyltransferase (CMP-KDO synthetase)
MSEFINVLVVIPARFASTRLPGKPLEMIGSKSMIHRVYDQAIKCNAVDKVVVATDDQRIMDYCEQHKLDCTMTKADHPSGTDRVAEVATQYPD